MPTSEENDDRHRDNGHYHGPERSCRICGHIFVPGDLIYLDKVSEFVFCYMEREPIQPGERVKKCHLVWNKIRRDKTPEWDRAMIFTGVVKFGERKQNELCYFGRKNCCDGCGRRFGLSESVFYVSDRGLIFCYNAGNLGGASSCFGKWKKRENPTMCNPAILEYWGDIA